MQADSTAPIEHSSARYTACEFKDSPLGQIPQEWDVKTIAETAAPITNSFTDGDWIEAPHIRQQGIRLVQTGNIGVGEFLDKAEDRKFISQESFAALGCKPLQTGDVLICRLAEPVGRACVVPDYISDAITAVDVTIYRPNPKLLRSRFAMWQMNTHSALNRCDVLAGGTTRKRISRLNLGRLPLAVPKIEEQITIEVVLDTVDEAIAKTQAVIAKLKQVRAGLLHDLLIRGLDENGQLRDPIAHPEQFQDSPLGRIPSKWLFEPLAKHTISSAYGPRFSGERYSDQGNVALLRTTDMDETGNLALEQMPLADLVIEEFSQHFLEPLDFLISRSGTCGIGAVFPGFRIPVLPGAFLIRFRLAPSLLPDFLRLYANSEIGTRRIRDLAEGGVQKNIRGSELLAHLVPIPPKAEQQSILWVVVLFDATTAVEETQLAKLQQLKSGLMNDLLTGRVRVPEGIAVAG